jgi:ATP-dependent Clp protease ATP-binding subunit ClpA
MFERYTEKARRAIFFARYESSQYGSPYIETEHLLLGVLREDKRLAGTLLSGTLESVYAQVDAINPTRPKTATNADLPLSNPAKHALKYAAEEADRLSHRSINCGHLLLGLLRDGDHTAAKILARLGVKVEAIREEVERIGEANPDSQARASVENSEQKRAAIVRIRDQPFPAAVVIAAVKRVCQVRFHWRRTAWKLRDAVIERKTGKLSLDLALAEDSTNFELLKGGWKKDRCTICTWELFRAEDEHGTGYFNGRDWICTECYEKFWDRPDFIAGSFGDMT